MLIIFFIENENRGENGKSKVMLLLSSMRGYKIAGEKEKNEKRK